MINTFLHDILKQIERSLKIISHTYLGCPFQMKYHQDLVPMLHELHQIKSDTTKCKRKEGKIY